MFVATHGLSLVVASGGYFLVVEHGRLIAVAFFVAEHGALGTQAKQLLLVGSRVWLQ